MVLQVWQNNFPKTIAKLPIIIFALNPHWFLVLPMSMHLKEIFHMTVGPLLHLINACTLWRILDALCKPNKKFILYTAMWIPTRKNGKTKGIKFPKIFFKWSALCSSIITVNRFNESLNWRMAHMRLVDSGCLRSYWRLQELWIELDCHR